MLLSSRLVRGKSRPDRAKERNSMSKRNKAAERAARAAALKAEQERKEKQRRLFTIGGVVACAAARRRGRLLPAEPGRQDRRDGCRTGRRHGRLRHGARARPAPTTRSSIYEDFICPACRTSRTTFDAVLDVRRRGRPGDRGVPARSTSSSSSVTTPSGAPTRSPSCSTPQALRSPRSSTTSCTPNSRPRTETTPTTTWLVEKAVEAGADRGRRAAGIEDLAFEAWVDATAPRPRRRPAPGHADRDRGRRGHRRHRGPGSGAPK